MDELEAQQVEVYAISPSFPEEHQHLMEEHDLKFELLTDNQELEFGQRFGFIDIGEESINRGYLAANPETNQLKVKNDYLVGENIEDVLAVLDDI